MDFSLPSSSSAFAGSVRTVAAAAAIALVATAMLLALPSRAAAASVQSSISRLATAGSIDATKAAKARTAYNQARSLRKRAKGARRTAITHQIRTVEAMARKNRITADRVTPLFDTLQNNVDWFRSNGPAAAGTDRRFSATGRIIFQYFAGQGWEFHPLSNFAKLNAVWTDKSAPARRALGSYAHELIGWAVNRGGALTWEYYFPFSGASAPFISSISQGTAIQSMARAGYALKDGSITAAAQQAMTAFNVEAPLGLKVVRDEGFHYLGYSTRSRLIILNMFLQSLDALHDYSIITDDPAAWDLYREGLKAARRETVASDTGAWSLYSVDGAESSLNYHQLVTGFLTKLCDETKEAVFCDTRDNFQRYTKEAPRIEKIVKRVKKRKITVIFTLSKISYVTVTPKGGLPVSRTLGHGRRKIVVSMRRSKRVTIKATDLAGNKLAISK